MKTSKHWSDAAIESVDAAIESLSFRLQELKHDPRVMVVDDNTHDAELLLNLLKDFPCEVMFCSTEHAAIEAMKNIQYDLVFLDLKLERPESGLAVMAAAASINYAISFVVVTGYVRSPDVKKALEMGAVAVLEKPPTHEQMAAIFQKIKT